MKNQIQLVLKDGIDDVLGKRTAEQAKEFLDIETGTIKSGKIYSVTYQLDSDQIDYFANQGLADRIINDVFINRFYSNPNYKSYILVAKLPGVTDDEGISAQKTLIDILNLDLETKTQHIFSQDIYLIEKDLTDDQLKLIGEKILANKLINHIEYGKITDTIDYIPDVVISDVDEMKLIDLNVDDVALKRISKERLLSLNLEEMKAIQTYFADKQKKRERKENGISIQPTDCELEMLAQTWSEHCKHKEFSANIDYTNHETGEKEEIKSLFKTYIRRSTEIVRERLTAEGNNWLLKIFTDNAGVVKIDDKSVFVWKVETHNSPSAIDPYGGAITGILGNNRDPLGTGIGGGKLLFNTNVLCFGPPNYDKELLPGQLHPRRIFEGVRHGIEDGGNKSGVPTINGSIIFDERYSGKPLVYCGTGGVMPIRFNGVDSWEKNIDAGDYIIMVGGRVGKDGIHGATFSSAEIDEHSPQSAVQIGSPITQKMVGDFMQEAAEAGLIKCSTDNGAGGLSSSICELATISGGAVVNLETVPLKYPNLKPWEIFISESQERMTFVVEEEKLADLFTLAREREVEVSNIGIFTSNGFIDVRFNNKKVAWLDMDFLHEGVPEKFLVAEWEKPFLEEPDQTLLRQDHERILKDLMASYNICSREPVIRQYDHEVKGKSIIKPLMGNLGKAPQDAAVMRLDHDSFAGIAVSNGICPKFGDIDAYEMSAGAFDEGIRQIISVGGKLPDPTDNNNRFWTVNDNFCVPDSAYDEETNPDGKLKLAKLVLMNKALFDMSTYYNIPMTSGKDSMKNDFKAGKIKISVPPTILYSVVAKIDDVRKTVTSNFKMAGDLIYQLGETYNELGGSEYYRLSNQLGANVPKVRKDKAKALYEKVMEANDCNMLQSCHDISDGGLIVTLTECLFHRGIGADVELKNLCENTNVSLYSESHSRFVVTIKPEDKAKFEKLFGKRASYLGCVISDEKLCVKHNGKTLIDIKSKVLEKEWDRGLEK